MANKFRDLFETMRPKQWTKNALVMAGFVFSIGDQTIAMEEHYFWKALAGTVLFCFMSSAVYLINDAKDVEQDRNHPVKKNRPIADGRLDRPFAVIVAIIISVAVLILSALLSIEFAVVVGAYLLLQICYTLWVKHVGLLDVFIISGGFVLRAIAGAVVIEVEFSPWLLLCASLLALFLALCKRRHEKVLNDTANTTRESLNDYSEKLLDQLIAVASSATIVCYSLYTLWPDTVMKFDTNKLALTIPFVIFGIFRYMDLVYRHNKGGHPEQILLTDGPLMLDIALYAMCVLWILL